MKNNMLAIAYSLAPDSPIVIACNHKEFQEEFEESPGFVKWLTEWTEW